MTLIGKQATVWANFAYLNFVVEHLPGRGAGDCVFACTCNLYVQHGIGEISRFREAVRFTGIRITHFELIMHKIRSQELHLLCSFKKLQSRRTFPASSYLILRYFRCKEVQVSSNTSTSIDAISSQIKQYSLPQSSQLSFRPSLGTQILVFQRAICFSMFIGIR